MSKEALATLAAISLTACGGGGTGTSGGSPAPSPAPAPAPAPAPSPTAEGLYIGTTSNGRTVTGIILDTGTYWVLYSGVNAPTTIAGAVNGVGTSANGSFSSANAKDFNLEGLGISDATVSASYIAKQTFNGTVTYTTAGRQNIAFTGSYNINYETAPSLATIAGNYSGTSAVLAGLDAATLTITADGTVSGQGASGCKFNGFVSPHASGNVYDVSITFNGAPCSNGTDNVMGIGYYDTATRRLYGTALNSGRTNGFIFTGTKL